MIIYDLKCEKGHKFEGWFKDRKAFEEQKEQKMISCPICGSFEARQLPSSPKIVSRNSGSDGKRDSRETSLLQKFQDYVNKHFEDVGERFAEVALNIFHGKEDPRNIKGTTTKQEEDQLKDEGVKFLKIPLPKLDS
ncbi:MAG: hypothetical protein A4E72_00072 [Syntrophus sp. PtaU1.Bin208]|nr:MAG: hypothetical protein A4E72_00072 [Syntrophus sp. PtaU1.Bin208]